jgi:uncharacterized repeat protein (TIGR03803 family)
MSSIRRIHNHTRKQDEVNMDKLDWRNRACTAVLLWATAPIGLRAQTFKTLHRFDGTDGAAPSELVQATGGNLYGTTGRGGVNDLGTVFKISPNGGPVKTLYSFCSQTGCTDGYGPAAALVQATGGNFYGTTPVGVDTNSGTVFRITPSGSLTTLYSFCPQGLPCTDGDTPQGGLVQATGGNLYGTTSQGGAATGCGGGGCGTVFKITPSGSLTTLYSFCSKSGCHDGSSPLDGLVQGTNGNFYGTTLGGAHKHGTIFKITPSGSLTTLYSFCSQSSCTDGAYPVSGLVQATDGNLYGTTSSGGANTTDCRGFGCGTVFKITPSGTLTTLYSFCSQSGCTDGAIPEVGLVQATDGNFYGTTVTGGANMTDCFGSSCGTVFKITPSGRLTTLYSFCIQSGCTDGFDPSALVQDTNGNFYGTTFLGGASTTACGGNGCGTVFSLSVGLGPFVKTQPDWGRAGRFVQILGTNLTGATSVSFNGTAAVFRVVLNSLIKTTVPAGATTGRVQVVTPGGTLSSNVPFRVLP